MRPLLPSLVSPLLWATLSLAVAAGCKKEVPQCAAYVDLAMKCDEDLTSAPANERSTAKVMLAGMCEEAFRNDTSSVSGETKEVLAKMYAKIRTRASCVAQANTCAQYDECTE